MCQLSRKMWCSWSSAARYLTGAPADRLLSSALTVSVSATGENTARFPDCNFTTVPRPPILILPKRRKGVLQVRTSGTTRLITMTFSGSDGMSLLAMIRRLGILVRDKRVSGNREQMGLRPVMASSSKSSAATSSISEPDRRLPSEAAFKTVRQRQLRCYWPGTAGAQRHVRTPHVEHATPRSRTVYLETCLVVLTKTAVRLFMMALMCVRPIW